MKFRVNKLQQDNVECINKEKVLTNQTQMQTTVSGCGEDPRWSSGWNWRNQEVE